MRFLRNITSLYTADDNEAKGRADAAHFIVLSSSGHQIEDIAAQLHGLHPDAKMSGGGAQAVFLDAGAAGGPETLLTSTVAIGFQCVQLTLHEHVVPNCWRGHAVSFAAIYTSLCVFTYGIPCGLLCALTIA